MGVAAVKSAKGLFPLAAGLNALAIQPAEDNLKLFILWTRPRIWKSLPQGDASAHSCFGQILFS
jgi:hypothetical protein